MIANGNAVLQHDATNVRGLFRQAKALFELAHYDEAVQPLKSLMQSPSKDVEREKVNETGQVSQEGDLQTNVSIAEKTSSSNACSQGRHSRLLHHENQE